MLSDITQLNDSHQLLRQLTHQLRNCRDHEVDARYARLLDYMEQVFRTEQHLMEEHAFPATQCHLEQHARVLCAMHRAHAALMRGDHALGRHVGAILLPGWFELHNATVDAAMLLWTSCRLSAHPRDVSHSTSRRVSGAGPRPSRPGSLTWRGLERRSQPRV